MSDSTNSRPEGQGYNCDALSYPSHQIFSSLDSLVGSGSSRPLQATPLASRAPSSSHCPPQAKMVRADLNRCGSELSEKDLVDLRSRMISRPQCFFNLPRLTDRANTPPPRLRTFFVIALDNSPRLPVHPFIVEVLSMVGVTPTAEFFLTSFSQRTHKDDLLYFTVRTDMKGFYEAFSSKVELDTRRDPFSFTSRHKEDAHAFSTFWEDKYPMPIHFYTDRRVIRDAGLIPPTDANPRALEALRVSYNMPDHVPPSPPAAPVVSTNQSPLR
ncbi:hypothetical protein LIER_42543 [Lithospermum erythrorhizon]|uniref:Uncharacterized protein n=1 Tax=Lithospermum erythrorhizon TaxID=34254 RepID=A0AAV3NH17_LITER